MPSFLPHRISPPSKLVVLNQACLDLPTASSEERKWGDDEEVEVADNEDSSRRLDKGKAPMESQNADDMNESTEDSTTYCTIRHVEDHPFTLHGGNLRVSDSEDHTHPYQLRETELEERIQYIIGGNSRYSDSEDHISIDRHLWEAGSEAHHTQFIIGLVKLNQSCVELPTSSSERRKWGDDCVEEEAESDEEGYAQITMDFREPRSPVGSIDSDTPIVRLDANILHPRALRMLGFNTKEGLEFEGMTEALTTMFKDPADYVLEAPRARTVLKLPERPQEVHSQLNQSCVELPTSSSERRKWGDDCVEEEAESDEEGYAQITMDFREPRSPVGSIDSDTPIVRLDANILHPRALRMLGFNTKEGLEFEGMTEALTTMFKDPADYVLEAPRARTVLKLPERPQEVHSQYLDIIFYYR
ncbi:hypothetical protein K7X08_029760 [Anisodus acutangulus]|uniref:Uncharacterized protein n=1 Tax=Anisodus acutangulus TaxID=402998 RepID=A0A9Q1QT64_9SOLA|nr:hypothetical protein K7X08_029760 [Anisodus acutangulus]